MHVRIKGEQELWGEDALVYISCPEQPQARRPVPRGGHGRLRDLPHYMAGAGRLSGLWKEARAQSPLPN